MEANGIGRPAANFCPSGGSAIPRCREQRIVAWTPALHVDGKADARRMKGDRCGCEVWVSPRADQDEDAEGATGFKRLPGESWYMARSSKAASVAEPEPSS